MSQDKVKVAISGELSAPELEDVLLELAKVRSGMLPAVPTDPPSHDSTAEVLPQDSPLFTVRTLVGGGIRIWLRHAGYGWIPLTLSATERDAVREFLGKQAGHTLTKH